MATIVGFVPDKHPLSASDWFKTRLFHRNAGHALCVGGFETTPCRWCGSKAKASITFLRDETDMLYTSCAVCGDVLRHWAVYETDVTK